MRSRSAHRSAGVAPARPIKACVPLALLDAGARAFLSASGSDRPAADKNVVAPIESRLPVAPTHDSHSVPGLGRRHACTTARLILLALLWPFLALAQSSTQPNAFTNPPIVLTVEGTNVWVQRFHSNNWESAYPKQVLHERDRGRTGDDSRTTIRLSDLSVLRIGWNSEFEIQPLPGPEEEEEFSLWKGLMRLLNRDRPGKHRFVTPTATAATRGTEFVLKVEEETGRTILTVFEGEAELSNAQGSVLLANGEQGVAEAGQAPTKTAVIDATAIVEWCLYYPGVLDLAELPLTPAEEAALDTSLSEYRSGDLLRALSAYPAGHLPASDAERVYLAALLLAVGQVERSEGVLDSLNETNPLARVSRLADALRLMVDAVNLGERSSTHHAPRTTLLSTEWLAESYIQQSRFNLSEALEAARHSVQQSPNFAFGWERIAELEFSYGRTKQAMRALERSLALAPRNAQAVALRGFLLAAQNRIKEASHAFDQSIALDGGLGNAWLGRGLCRIRQGHPHEGRFDLQVAAAVEPQRSALRSYLGKAFANAGDSHHAEKELRIAEELDPNDPTPWLYSALLLRDLDRINEAVRDLNRSQRLNDNRQVYRSRLLLDQDRAVRGANLARIYRDAGMTDVSLREAGRAVNADYANYSAHLFLADSFDQLRDIKQINLRYETAWFTEYLVANLLAPVGAGTLSQTVSQQEYSKLFEHDGLGISSSTEYLSDGEWIQSAAQFGTFGNSSYAAEVFYHADDGNRPNNDLEQFATVLHLKQQLSPRDNLYLRLNYSDSDYGDVNQYFRQTDANTGLRTHERYEPSVLAGYHHEWGPGSHTLLLAGRAESVYESDNPSQQTFFFNRGFVGNPIQAVYPLFYQQNFRNEFELYTAHLQHIQQVRSHSLVVGGRIQTGALDTSNRQTNGAIVIGGVTNYVAFSPDQDFTTDLLRGSLYAYDHWQVWDSLLLAAGVSYDWLRFPVNFRYAPVSSAQDARDQLSPKVGLIWTPSPRTTVRAAYFQSLSGLGQDQSYRLEPSQVAGFNQAYRSLIPESVAGVNAGATFETWALSLEQKIGRGTFVAITGELLSSEVNRTLGVVEYAAPFGGGSAQFSTPGTSEALDFHEKSLAVTMNQLLGNELSLGARYRISRAELDDSYPDIPSGATLLGGFQTHRHLEAVLQQASFFALYNHPSGFFARADALWTAQSNRGYASDLAGDDFWQFNVEAGYRFARRRAEVRLSLLNLTDQDYQLNPLNLTAELPRERTLAVSFQFNF